MCELRIVDCGVKLNVFTLVSELPLCQRFTRQTQLPNRFNGIQFFFLFLLCKTTMTLTTTPWIIIHYSEFEIGLCSFINFSSSSPFPFFFSLNFFYLFRLLNKWLSDFLGSGVLVFRMLAFFKSKTLITDYWHVLDSLLSWTKLTFIQCFHSNESKYWKQRLIE